MKWWTDYWWLCNRCETMIPPYETHDMEKCRKGEPPMSNSWGHGIKSASEDERQSYAASRCQGKCQGAVVFRLRYNYITGRAGRVGINERYVCEEHGRKFAAKYGLEVPDPSIPGEGSKRRGFINSVIAGATAKL